MSNIVASFPSVSLRPLYYGTLETNKIIGLKRHRQNYDAETESSNEACSEIYWWKFNIENYFRI